MNPFITPAFLRPLASGTALLLTTLALSAAPDEKEILADSLLGSTSGHLVGGTLSTDGYQPGLGAGHILYTLPATLEHGAIEVELRGVDPTRARTGKESKAAWLSMYDGRGVPEPAAYDPDFKQNFFRANIGWNFNIQKFQCTLVAAAPNEVRRAAARAVFGPKFEDRDFSTEPTTQSVAWDAARWYRLRYEWHGGRHRLLVDGVEVWRVDCPYPYAPVEHRLRLGAPGRDEKFLNQLPALTYRHLRVLALPTRPIREPADFPRAKGGSGGAKFLAAHDAFLARTRSAPINLLFVGDSITEGWNDEPALWEKFFAAHRPANFGIGGDQTQHVLWRLKNGELTATSPRVVVLLIGTNNTGQHSALEIAGAIRRILRTVFENVPRTHIILHAVFPRGPRRNSNGSLDDGVHRTAVIRELNPLLAAIATEPFFSSRVRFVDLTAVLSQPDGTPRPDLFRDNLHLTSEGYRVWAEALQPHLAELLR